jgi:hypothetical protein
MAVAYSHEVYEHSSRRVAIQREVDSSARHSGPSTTDSRDHHPGGAGPYDSDSSYSRSILGDPRFQNRGNGPVHIALMTEMQQTHGNRAVQRFIQRASSSPAPPVEDEDLGSRIESKAGRGENIEPGVKGQLEKGLGTDLSGVRVHTDGEADHMARSVDSVAFTSGQDIFFRSGAYDPGSREGVQLLAHEATHTVQQSQGAVAGTPTAGGVAISDPSDTFEQQASQTADRVTSGIEEESSGTQGHGQVQRLPGTAVGGTVQRQVSQGAEEEVYDLKSPDEQEPAAQPMRTWQFAASVQRQGGKPTLSLGSGGPAVSELQSALNAAGANPQLSVDGQFGPKTRAAVVAFQQANGLAVDGVVGPQTWGKLGSGGAVPPTGTGGATGVGGTTTGEETGGTPGGTPTGKETGGGTGGATGGATGGGGGLGPGPSGEEGFEKSKEAHDAFTKILDPKHTPQAGEDLVGQLASVLQVPESVVAKAKSSLESNKATIVPGNMQSIIEALSAFKAAAIDAAGQTGLSPKEEQRLLERIDALVAFYQQQANQGSGTVSSERQSVISVAQSQIGMVSAKELEADPDNPGRMVRVGWKRLNEYFAGAFGGDGSGYSKERVKRMPGGGAKDDLPSWCGLFDLWAYRTAGVNVGTWKTGFGIGSVDGMTVVPKSDVKPGDVGGIQHMSQHHYIVVKVDGDSITSIDGNTSPGDNPNGGQTAVKQRSLSDTTLFFRPKELP